MSTDPAAATETDWMAILASSYDGPEWVDITPERVAMISLIDCHEQIEKSEDFVLRLALAAKSGHLALQAALTAAIAGTASIGAHPEKLRIKYLEHFEESRTKPSERPESDRVMTFSELLTAATSSNLPWLNAPLSVTPEQAELLDRLTSIRNSVEHTKQMLHSIEPDYILETLPVISDLTLFLLTTVSHHFEPDELDQVKNAAAAIVAICKSKLDSAA
jgi:hypothetical protein